MQVQPSLNVSTVRTDLPVQSVDSDPIIAKVQAIMEEAAKEPQIEAQKIKYNEAFVILREAAQEGELSPEQKKELHKLFETYVSTTCYNKGFPIQGSEEMDWELGFEISARIMELSVLIQLQDLDLYDLDMNWTKAANLDELFKDAEDNKVLTAVYHLNIDGTVIANKAHDAGTRETLANALVKMTYSHQNIFRIRSTMTSFNKKWEDITYAVIGDETIDQKKKATDYQYNRVGLEFERKKSKLTSEKDQLLFHMSLYDLVKKKFESFCEADDPFLLGKLSQIGNMQGLTLMRDRDLSEEERAYAQNCFMGAFIAREGLVNMCRESEEFKRTGKMTEEHKGHEYFLANIRTGLIGCLLQALTRDNEALQAHVEALQKFDDYLESIGDKNTYRQSYRAAINKVKYPYTN